MREAFQAVPAWTDHLEENASLKARLDTVFGTAGLDAWASWCVYNFLFNHFLRHIFFFRSDDHFFDALTARTCHGHPLPCNKAANDTCVSENDAASVFAIGDFEYKLGLVSFWSLIDCVLTILPAATSGMQLKMPQPTIRSLSVNRMQFTLFFFI